MIEVKKYKELCKKKTTKVKNYKKKRGGEDPSPSVSPRASASPRASPIASPRANDVNNRGARAFRQCAS